MYYYKYLKYLVEHKKNVFIECMKMSKEYLKYGDIKVAASLMIHALTHDLDKFKPKTFIPYSKYLYGYDGRCLEKSFNYESLNNGMSCLSRSYLKSKNTFDNAKTQHHKSNKHHLEYWVGRDMPVKYAKQMVCDIRAMTIRFGGTAQKYYLKHYRKWNMTNTTRRRIETELHLNKE